MVNLCDLCGSVCGSLTTEPIIEGDGPILLVLSEYTSEVDYGGSFFSGKYKRVLDKLLQGSGLKREDCTFVSVISCLGEARTDERILTELLNTRENIIVLGEEAGRYLLRRSNIRDSRGGQYPIHKSFKDVRSPRSTWLSYGVENCLFNPNYTKVVIQDLIKFTNQDKPEETIQWEWWDGQEIPYSEVYSYDIETIDEKGSYTEWATQCAVLGETFCYVSRPNKQSAYGLAARLEEKWVHSQGNIRIVGHNSWGFDVPKTRLAGLPAFPLGEDTMALAYLDDETQAKGLESLAVKYLGVKGWKDQFEHPLGTPEFAAYNARDTVHTYNLYHKLKETLGERLILYNAIIKPAHVALARMSDRGIFILAERVKRIKKVTEWQLERVLRRIRAITPEGFNPGSSIQLAKLLEDRGYYLPRTKKGNPQTSSEILEGLDDELAQYILKYRKYSKRINTYLTNYAEIASRGDGRVHSIYSVTTAATGRSTSRAQNTQNVDRELKSIYGAPPGKVLLNCDFSAIEFRLAGWVAQEPTITKNFAENPNWDPHRFFASKFYRKPESEVTEKERQIAKSANFGLCFLGTGYTLVIYAAGLGIKISLQEGEDLCDMFHETFPGMREWYERTKDFLKRNSYIETVTGRRRHYGDYAALSPKRKNDALREAVNTQAQGLAADIAFLCLVELDRIGLPIVNFVHDSIVFEFSSLAEMEESLVLIKYIMEEFPKKKLKELFNIDLDMPLRIKSEWKVY